MNTTTTESDERANSFNNWFYSDWNSNGLLKIMVILLPISGFFISMMLYGLIKMVIKAFCTKSANNTDSDYYYNTDLEADRYTVFSNNKVHPTKSNRSKKSAVKSKTSRAAHRQSRTKLRSCISKVRSLEGLQGSFQWKLQVQQMLEKMILQKHINLSYVSADQKRQILQLFSIYKKIESAAFQVGCKVSFATTE